MPSGSTAVNPLQAVFLRLLRYRRYSSLTVAGQSRDGSPTGLSGTLPVLLAEQQRKDAPDDSASTPQYDSPHCIQTTLAVQTLKDCEATR